MPVTVRLDPDKRHLIYEMSDPTTIDELLAAYEQEREFRDSIPYTLHSLVDMSRLRGIPPRWLTAKAGPGLTHPRSGEMVFCGLSVSLKIIVQTITRITNYQRMRFFDTREQAEAYMKALLAKSESQPRQPTA
jgi:hypothetical protein